MLKHGCIWRRMAVALATFFATTLALAAPVDVTYVGTWASTGSGNAAAGGPNMSAGQRFVVRLTYDDLSAVTNNVDILNAFFVPSGDLMTTVNLQAAGNSVDIFVPMEGFDTATPFIYTQDEGDHFPAFIPTPTLNFTNLSSISDPNNIIGLEFEGNFVPNANFNVIELFNTSSGGGNINMVSQVLNCGDINCLSSAPAVSVTGPLATAVDLIVDAGPDRVYSAASLDQTTAMSVSQSNDLGAARADGEDFVDTLWSQTGTPTGNDITVDIADSGLTTTTDTATWTMTATEQMTLKSDTDNLVASYLNAAPTASANAVAVAGGTDFALSVADMDLIVNGIIAGFEMVTTMALVNGIIDATAFFNGLIMTGIQSETNAALQAAFGLGNHTVAFTATDKAGATAIATAAFEVLDQQPPPQPVPEPATPALLLAGLLLLVGTRRGRSLLLARGR